MLPQRVEKYRVQKTGESFDFDKVLKIAAGPDYVLALREDGKVYAWGSNSHYKLGNNSISSSSMPIVINNLENITAIAAGQDHALALGENGKVYAWGYNHKGQLGRNYAGNSDYYAPSPVLARGGNGTLSGAVDIAAATTQIGRASCRERV